MGACWGLQIICWPSIHVERGEHPNPNTPSRIRSRPRKYIDCGIPSIPMPPWLLRLLPSSFLSLAALHWSHTRKACLRGSLPISPYIIRSLPIAHHPAHLERCPHSAQTTPSLSWHVVLLASPPLVRPPYSSPCHHVGLALGTRDSPRSLPTRDFTADPFVCQGRRDVQGHFLDFPAISCPWQGGAHSRHVLEKGGGRWAPARGVEGEPETASSQGTESQTVRLGSWCVPCSCSRIALTAAHRLPRA
ncbi:hypothetical protein DFH07DRAFT_851683 [Mycena maculata]|uniref:Uncharacterized protein n=1 Tax=Mycena maculata TaxID=230809 RepID=A0AAD7HSZ4_9AGAR|nr:hypothetical protein DFH07DRAFT_851683 [Mycena maculata]